MANVAHKDFAVVTLALDDKVLISDTSAAGATKNVINVPALTAAQTTALATGVPGLTSAGVVSNLAGTTVATLTTTAATLPGSLTTAGNIVATLSSVTGYSLRASGGGGANIGVFTDSAPIITLGASSDVVLTRGAANILQLRNSTAAQAFQVYNTYTDSSNGEWGAMRFSSNVLEIGAFANGTGTVRPIRLVGALAAGTATAGTAPIKLTSGTNLTTAENGAFEYNGTNLFFTRAGAVREGVLTQSAITTETGIVMDTSITVNIGGTSYKLMARAV